MTMVETDKESADAAAVDVNDCDAYVMVKYVIDKDLLNSRVIYSTSGIINDKETIAQALYPIAVSAKNMIEEHGCNCETCQKLLRICEGVIAVIEREDLPEATKLS